MAAGGGNEVYEISCDSGGNRARIAMIGSQGSEILIVMPYAASPGAPDEEAIYRILKEGEARLRAALLSLISKRWPSDAE